jgi:hypothetical protein
VQLTSRPDWSEKPFDYQGVFVIQVDWPPIFEAIEADGPEPAAAAVLEATRRVEAGKTVDGVIMFGTDPARLALALVLDPDDVQRFELVRFAVANAVTDALAQHLPPMLPLTHGSDGSVFLDGTAIGRIALIRDERRAPEWIVVAIDLALLGEDASIECLSGETVALADLLGSLSRHMLGWINRWQDDGFGPVRDAWNFRCHERLTDQACGIDDEGEFRSGSVSA